MRFKKNSKVDPNGKKYKVSAGLEVPAPDINDIYVEVTTVDRLDQLAQKYLGDRSLWYVIANANNIGKGTIAIHKGTIIRIPRRMTGNGTSGGY